MDAFRGATVFAIIIVTCLEAGRISIRNFVTQSDIDGRWWILSFLFFSIDGAGYRKAAFPFLVLGTNALVVFVESTLVADLMGLLEISENDVPFSLITYIYNHFLSPAA